MTMEGDPVEQTEGFYARVYALVGQIPPGRVVRADGSIAGGGYAALRRALLEGEGIPFTADGRVDMARCAWEIPPQEVHHG